MGGGWPYPPASKGFPHLDKSGWRLTLNTCTHPCSRVIYQIGQMHEGMGQIYVHQDTATDERLAVSFSQLCTHITECRSGTVAVVFYTRSIDMLLLFSKSRLLIYSI